MTAPAAPAKPMFHISATNRDGEIEDWTEAFADTQAAHRALIDRGYEIRLLEPIVADVWEAGRDREPTQGERDLRAAADKAEEQKRLEDELMRRGKLGTVANSWLTGQRYRKSDLWDDD